MGIERVGLGRAGLVYVFRSLLDAERMVGGHEGCSRVGGWSRLPGCDAVAGQRRLTPRASCVARTARPGNRSLLSVPFS